MGPRPAHHREESDPWRCGPSTNTLRATYEQDARSLSTGPCSCVRDISITPLLPCLAQWFLELGMQECSSLSFSSVPHHLQRSRQLQGCWGELVIHFSQLSKPEPPTPISQRASLKDLKAPWTWLHNRPSSDTGSQPFLLREGSRWGKGSHTYFLEGRGQALHQSQGDFLVLNIEGKSHKFNLWQSIPLVIACDY